MAPQCLYEGRTPGFDGSQGDLLSVLHCRRVLGLFAFIRWSLLSLAFRFELLCPLQLCSNEL